MKRALLMLVLAACGTSGGTPPADGGTDDCQCIQDGGSEASPGPKDPLDPSYRPPFDNDPSHYPANIWITDDMQKIRPNDPPGMLHWALISAARNEFESFQVHVHADTAITGLSIEVSDLKDARSGMSISDITVSRELYLNITANTVSDKNGMVGEIPDALVPAVDPYFKEKRNAFPIDLAQGRNASAWIDVHVPQGTPSGWYTGSVTVKDQSKTLATMPILLKLWQVDLPSTASLRTNFGYSWNGACVQEYGGYNGCGKVVNGSDDEGVEYFHILYATFALDHRVTLSDVVYAGPLGNDWTHFDNLYGPLMEGTGKTRLPGAKLTAMNYSGGTSDKAALGNWATHFKAKNWMDRLAFYHCDEPPNGCSFSAAKAEEDLVHGVDPTFRTLLTTNIDQITMNNMLGSVDIAVPIVEEMQPHGGQSQRSKYDSFLQMSPQKMLFWYQSCDEHESCGGGPGPATATWPSYMADATPMRNRVFQWMAYMFDVKGELYYATDLCFQQTCGGQTDPLKSIYAFAGNGDGTLFYPGRPATIGGTKHVPLSSIRFELIREGMEDYELLRQSAPADAKSAIQSFISAADTFAADPAKLMAARETLGDRLHLSAISK